MASGGVASYKQRRLLVTYQSCREASRRIAPRFASAAGHSVRRRHSGKCDTRVGRARVFDLSNTMFLKDAACYAERILILGIVIATPNE